MKIAVIHDWLVTYAGAERVLEQILLVYPEADVFSLIDFIPAEERAFLLNKSVQTSFMQRFPFARRRYRSYLAFMPLAIEQLDLSGYDLVISSSFAVAKGVITSPSQLHISYVHSPIRYAWDLQHQYLTQAGLQRGLKSVLARLLLHYIRIWDTRTANGVDAFIANSNFVARRIQKVYGRNAHVIYPPVDVSTFALAARPREDFYLTASRMVPYKRIDLIVDAFARMPHRRLVVIGDGPDFPKLRTKASANVELLGYQSTDLLREYMQRARAFVFAAEEDFGITLVEAQACGAPVIAFGRGGARETVIGALSNLSSSRGRGATGIFFESQTVSSLVAAVEQFERSEDVICPATCHDNALRFSADRFRKEFKAYVNKAWMAFVKEQKTDS